MDQITAPAGWGHVPGMPLGEITYNTLPDLPMLRLLPARRRVRVITETLRALPYLGRVEAHMVAKRYRIPYASAYNALLASKTGKTRKQHSRELREAA